MGADVVPFQALEGPVPSHVAACEELVVRTCQEQFRCGPSFYGCNRDIDRLLWVVFTVSFCSLVL